MGFKQIHRVRRERSDGDGTSVRVHHMDLWADSEADAMDKAQNNDNLSWRWIDTFDSSENKFENYEYLGEIDTGKHLHKTYGY